MKKMSKNGKNVIILAVIFVLFVIVLISSIILFIGKNDEESSETSYDSKISLPNINTVDYRSNPLMYDFLNGSLGYCYKESNFVNFGPFFAILRYNDSYDTIFISYYNYAEKVTLPILGTEIMTLNANAGDYNSQSLEQSMNGLSSLKRFEEDDYTLYVVSETEDLNLNSVWGSIKFLDSGSLLTRFNPKNGPMYERIYTNGLGWPTEWLRSDEYFINALKEEGVDITNSFFDRYSLYSCLKFKTNKEDVDEQNREIAIKVNNIECFDFEFDGNEVEIRGEDDLNVLLSEFEYERY